MNVILLEHTPNPDRLCGEAAAICTDSDNPEKALRAAMRSGHESVLEHATFTFKVEGVSRALLAQLTRHRIASFSVQSQRYVDMDGAPVVVPPSIAENTETLETYQMLMDAIRNFYRSAVGSGIPKEDARFILPNATETKLIMTMNVRELRHFFALRTCNRAQWEIRQLADAMLERCKRVAPIIFADAGCACMAEKPCPEARPCGDPRGGKAV